MHAHSPGIGIRATLFATAAAAIAVPLLVVRNPPPMPPPRLGAVTAPERVVPPAELPPVEPVAYADMTPEAARSFNATVPFSTLPNPAARAYRLAASGEDRARAIDCLAAAEWYEAGDDPEGQRAVAQVVINRLRHPAFPKSVCGVVFQGSERSTGCQFTFTCDGALARTPSEAAWERARQIATGALSGQVFRPIGYSTHYHTDWVVPYWSASLDKVTAVGSHLFFRWTGWWGTPGAFRRGYAGAEPIVAMLARLSPAHAAANPEQAASAAIAGMGKTAMPKPIEGDPGTFLVTLPLGLSPDGWPALAMLSCGASPDCKFLGWTDKALTPAALPPSTRAIEAMAFSYLRQSGSGITRTLWNCTRFKRTDADECMRRLPPDPPAPKPGAATAAPTTSPQTQADLVPVLSGVRRKSEAVAVDAPAVHTPPARP